MSATLAWGTSGVTITFPSDDFYPDDTGQTWVMNEVEQPESAATHSATLAPARTALYTLTVIQQRPSGAVRFTKAGFSYGTVNVTLTRVP